MRGWVCGSDLGATPVDPEEVAALRRTAAAGTREANYQQMLVVG